MNRIWQFLPRRPADQPKPLDTQVAHLRRPSGVVTAITRVWDDGAPERCKLCPRCTARLDVCTIVVGRYVPQAAAATFSTVGLTRQEGGAP